MAAKSKFSEHLIRLKCSKCAQMNYYTRKNKKKVERKLEFNKFCKHCRASTKHKEAKK